MPRATRYALQRGNDAVGPYRLYLDRTMHDDVTWRPFADYTQVVPFDGIPLYSSWLACGTGIMVRYLPERCMRQFGFVQRIPIWVEWQQHVVSQEYRLTRVTQDWHSEEGYVTWFYRVSHPLMRPDIPDAPRPAHEEILENQQAEDDHAIDLLPICQRITMLGRDALDRGVVLQGGPDAVAVMETIVTDAGRAAGYMRQRRAQGERVRHTQ